MQCHTALTIHINVESEKYMNAIGWPPDLTLRMRRLFLITPPCDKESPSNGTHTPTNVYTCFRFLLSFVLFGGCVRVFYCYVFFVGY